MYLVVSHTVAGAASSVADEANVGTVVSPAVATSKCGLWLADGISLSLTYGVCPVQLAIGWGSCPPPP